MSLLSSLGAELKALQKLTGPRDPFARSQSYSLGSSLVSQSNSLDLDRLVTDPLHNGVVAACVNAIARALPDAPLLLEQRTSSGWRIVEEHPCLEVLRSPNPDHSDADVWGLTSGYKATRGQAFWLLLPNSRGEVGEIHVWNPDRVTVLGDEEQFILGYRVQRESDTHFLADKRQIIHFRHLPDFSNPRLGWSPLRTGRAQIAGDNVAASYHTSILFNAGVVSLLVSLKEGAMSGQVTPEQFQTVLTNLRRAGRERAGGIEGINLPLEVHKLAYSPDEMNIDRLIEYYETRICSVMGVSQRVAGLGSDPTYNNLSEALNDFWERRIVPDRNADAATLNRQWLPLWGLDSGSWRFRFDYSNVPALQENRDALHARVRADWEKGLLDKQQARSLLGYGTENDGEFARVFYGETPKTQTEGELSGAQLDEIKALIRQWDESKHPRDERGRFAGGIEQTLHRTVPHGSEGYGRPAIEAATNFRIGPGSQVGIQSEVHHKRNGIVFTEEAYDLDPTALNIDLDLLRRYYAPRKPPKDIHAHNPLKRHLVGLLEANTQLDSKTRERFRESLEAVADQTLPEHHEFLIQKIQVIRAFSTKAELNEVGNQLYPDSWPEPSTKAVAAWIDDDSTLIIDGAGDADTDFRYSEKELDSLRQRYYAHEIAHALDRLPPSATSTRKPGELISETQEWLDAYGTDKRRWEKNLSKRASVNPEEGYAEMVAFLKVPKGFTFSTAVETPSDDLRDDAHTHCQKHFEDCYKVLLREGLI